MTRAEADRRREFPVYWSGTPYKRWTGPWRLQWDVATGRRRWVRWGTSVAGAPHFRYGPSVPNR